MNFIYEQIGEFGVYQKLIFVALSFSIFLMSPHAVFAVFTEAITKHRCFVPNCEETSSATYEADFLNFTTPSNKLGNYDECRRYGIISPNETECSAESFNRYLQVTCSKWIYDTSQFASTTVTEFDLVCERSFLVPLSGISYMSGMMVGSVVIGYIADRFGRRFGFLTSALVFGSGGLAGALPHNYIVYVILRFVTGIGALGVYNVAIVLCLEMVGVRWRTFLGVMAQIPFSLGEAAVALVAYFARDFRWVQGICTLPVLFLISYYWLLPESFVWLLAKGKEKEVLKVTHRIASVNGKYGLLYFPIDNGSISAQNYTEEGVKEQLEPKEISFLKLISYPNIRKRTLILFYCWWACGMVFFGLSLNSGNLSGNVYLNFSTSMLIEIPASITNYFVLERCGRRRTTCVAFLLSGFASVISGFLHSDLNWLVITMNLIGKFGITVGYGAILMFTAELFPTDYRSIGVGACSMTNKLGGLLAPYVASLGVVNDQLSFWIFGGVTVLAGFMALNLPETAGIEMPQTLLEAENLGLNKWNDILARKGGKNFKKKQNNEIKEENASLLNGTPSKTFYDACKNKKNDR